MKCLYLFLFLFSMPGFAQQKSPCSSENEYRKFDFWIGEWDVMNLKNKKAGDSRISLILDSCIILEEWTGANGYAGKSFNTYNAATKQWQQTWVDNAGGSTEFLSGKSEPDKIIFYADKVTGPKGEIFKRRLTFFKVNNDLVRQLGEKSTDGKTWVTEYDLAYHRKRENQSQ